MLEHERRTKTKIDLKAWFFVFLVSLVFIWIMVVSYFVYDMIKRPDFVTSPYSKYCYVIGQEPDLQSKIYFSNLRDCGKPLN